MNRKFFDRKFFEYGGFIAGAVLIVFGVASIAMSWNGMNTVKSSLKGEYIVGSADMNPAQIKAEAQNAKLDLAKLSLPTCNVANKAIDTGDRARCFAQYMRIHTLESTGGLTYSQMGQYMTPSGKSTSDASQAAKDPKTGQPVANAARNLWVTETALTTALNTSYLASQIALFGIVVGVALLLSGIGFVILALFALGTGPAREATKAAKVGATAPTAV
jgi:hypothetical protein